MFETFGFDPKTLSNDDLFNKQMELARRKTMAARMGRPEMVGHLDMLIQAIDFERRERMYVDRFNLLPQSPIVVESDPELREQESSAEEALAPKSNQPARPSRRAVRTSKPVLPSDGV